MKLVSYNIQYGLGADGRYEIASDHHPVWIAIDFDDPASRIAAA